MFHSLVVNFDLKRELRFFIFLVKIQFALIYVTHKKHGSYQTDPKSSMEVPQS